MADCTIIDKLNYILETKDLIKTAIETQDVEVLESDTFRKYSEYITEIRKVASVNGQTGDIVLKTINGQDLVGEGDITISGDGGTIDLSNYYTKEEINSLIPTIFVQKIIQSSNKLVVVDQDGQTTELNFATINGSNILGNSSDITVEGGGSGVEYIAPTENPSDWDMFYGGIKLFTSWVDLNDDGIQETLDTRIGGKLIDGSEGSTLWYGFTSSDNSILLGDYSSRLDLKVNPDILSGTSSGDVDLSNYYTKDETYSKEEVDALIPSGGATYTAGDGISISEDNVISNSGVTVINIGKAIQDWTQKTGVVSFYTDWYDGSYDVAIGGTSFYGLKPIDNTIILENAGGTTNGNTRCGIKVNQDNFKTINGESIFGSGDITISGGDGQGLTDIFVNNGKLIGAEADGNWRNEVSFKTINGQTIIGEEGDITIEGGSGTINIVELTQAEYDALTEYADNTFYVITDTNKQYTTLEEVEQQGYLKAIPDTYVTNEELSTATSDKVSQTALNEAIQGVEAKIPTVVEYTAGNGISITEDNVISIKNINVNDTPSVLIGKNVNGDYYGSVLIGNDITNGFNASILIGSGVSNTVNNRTVAINIGNTFLADSNSNIYVWKGTETVKLQDYLVEPSDYYTKAEIDSLIGGVSDKISEINSMI